MFFANRKVQRRKTALVGVGCSAYTSLTVEFDTSLSPCVSKISKLTSIEFIKKYYSSLSRCIGHSFTEFSSHPFSLASALNYHGIQILLEERKFNDLTILLYKIKIIIRSKLYRYLLVSFRESPRINRILHGMMFISV